MCRHSMSTPSSAIDFDQRQEVACNRWRRPVGRKTGADWPIAGQKPKANPMPRIVDPSVVSSYLPQKLSDLDGQRRANSHFAETLL
jgi:hypothetical protein